MAYFSNDIITCPARSFKCNGYPSDERIEKELEKAHKYKWGMFEFCYDNEMDLFKLLKVNGERIAITIGRKDRDGYPLYFRIHRLDKSINVRRKMPQELIFKKPTEEVCAE